MTTLTIDKEQILKYGIEFIISAKEMKCPTCERNLDKKSINKKDFESFIISKVLRERYY